MNSNEPYTDGVEIALRARIKQLLEALNEARPIIVNCHQLAASVRQPVLDKIDRLIEENASE